MEIVVIFARQGFRRDIESVKIARQPGGVCHGERMGYA
jgi:hypothetical protein